MKDYPEFLEADLMLAYPGLPEMQYQCLVEQANFDRNKALALTKVQYDNMCIKRAQKFNRARAEAKKEEAIWA